MSTPLGVPPDEVVVQKMPKRTLEGWTSTPSCRDEVRRDCAYGSTMECVEVAAVGVADGQLGLHWPGNSFTLSDTSSA
jgi:hypothetical protein